MFQVHTALIHFIGLITFATISPSRNTLTVSHAETSSSSRVMAVMPNVAEAGSVDPHEAVIAFRPCDLVAADGWPIESFGQFLYVKLEHDAISFEADRETASPAVPPQLPSVGAPLDSYWSASYKNTAAVFSITAGTLSACYSGAPGTDGTRKDTELTLRNSKTITIKSGQKKLTLQGDATAYHATAYIANLPTWYLEGNMSGHQMQSGARTPPHYEVYCQMAGVTDPAACKAPRMNLVPKDCGPCAANAAKPYLKVNGPQFAQVISAECSNSRFP